jgi:TQXA domain-containing protein/LPXTG-motif cell wall-anchored protein
MISVRRRGAARLAAAVLASGLVAAGAFATAGSAVADGISVSVNASVGANVGGAVATLGDLKVYSGAVIHDHGKNERVSAGLFEMSVDSGGTIETYCIDIKNPTQSKAKYQEEPWSATSLGGNPNAGKINWILQNSYPQVTDLAALAAKAGAGALTPRTAAAGTQVAIWHFSDNADVDAVNPAAEKLAVYLEKHAQNVQEPKSSLSLSPAAVSGKSGDRVGPVTVHTDAASVSVGALTGSTSAGVIVVDASGKKITRAVNGEKIYFEVPAGAAAGSATLSVQASAKIAIGRAFASATKSQTQILAGASVSSVSAGVSVNWAKTGPIPALSAALDCAKGGVDITATNKGDQAFTFELAGEKHSIAVGKSETITVPVKEDQGYKFTISGPNGFVKTFSGIRNCLTATGSGTPSSQTPASTSGSNANLAETGSSSSTPVIAGVAAALVVAGGGAVFFLRKKKAGNTAA